MKRRITILIVAALAVALCVTSLAACGTSASVKDLYELVFEAERADESVTTISAKELDFDNAMPTLLDGAVVFEETDGTDAVRHLMIDGNVVYSGDGVISSVLYEGAGWIWAVEEPDPYKLAFYTADGEVKSYDKEGITYTSASDGEIDVSNGDRIVYDSDKDRAVFIAKGGSSPSLMDKGEPIYQGDEAVIYDLSILGHYVYLVEDKDGERICLVDLDKVIPEDATDGSAEVIFLTEKGVLLQKVLFVPNDAKDYDYYIGGDKYIYFHYFYEWESGKLTEKKLDFVFTHTESDLYGVVIEDGDAPAYIRTIDDDKTLSKDMLQYFDKDFNISVDIQAIFPGLDDVDATSVWGDYLVLSDGAVVRLYDSGGKLVTEFVEGTRRLDQSGMFVYGDGYFTVAGKYAFTIDSAQTFYIASAPGKVYFVEYEVDELGNIVTDLEDNPKGKFKVYDVATGRASDICDVKDYHGTDGDVYFVSDGEGNNSVYRISDGTKVIDFTAERIEMEVVGEDILIACAVIDSATQTETVKYIYVNKDVAPANA